MYRTPAEGRHASQEASLSRAAYNGPLSANGGGPGGRRSRGAGDGELSTDAAVPGKADAPSRGSAPPIAKAHRLNAIADQLLT